MYFDGNMEISNVTKYDDHDRAKKGDIAFDYRDYTFTVEVKSLQTASMKPQKRSGKAKPYFQCDASDSRLITLPNGEKKQTTSLIKGQFDLLAVNLHAFKGDWFFAFADNRDLPTVAENRGAEKNYSEYERGVLLKGTMFIDNPPTHPYYEDPMPILDELVRRRMEARIPTNTQLAAEGRTSFDILDDLMRLETGIKIEELEDKKKSKRDGKAVLVEDDLFADIDVDQA
jgi:hypothetical protein